MATREITGYAAVLAAARDTMSFSSDLQGDRDVRDYRQLPLEADPPRHTKYREALQPLFIDATIEQHVPAFRAVARDLIGAIEERGGGDIVADVALPYVMGCLALIYDRPQDLGEWISWGPDVWTAEAHQRGEVTAESLRVLRDRDFDAASERNGRILEEYLARVFDEAAMREASGNLVVDIWDKVHRLEIDGTRIDRAEQYGIANVLLAGGRETVMKLLTGVVWHLIRTPDDRHFLMSAAEARPRAIAELVRYLSPLPKIERIESSRRGTGAEPAPEAYVLLNFASANHDRSVWPDADRIDIHRARHPHAAFGFGRHSCLGMSVTQREIGAFLDEVLSNWPGWRFDGEPEIAWIEEGEGESGAPFLDRFDRVRVVVAG